MNVRTDLHRLIDEVLDDDPRPALIAYRRLAKEPLPWLEQRVVALARRDGRNWAKIGRLLDVSRAALHARFRTIVPRVAASARSTATRGNARPFACSTSHAPGRRRADRVVITSLPIC